MEPQQYTRVSIEKPAAEEHSDSESCISANEGLITGLRKPTYKFISRQWLKRSFWTATVFVVAASYIAMFFVGRHSYTNVEMDEMCMYQTSPYSPILKHMDPTPRLTQFNGTLGYPSEFTGDPSPEVDAAWDKWGYVKYASIPEDEFLKLPGAKEHFQDAARLTPEYGGGYIGFLEFSHHMHCLNMLRQGIHQDYYNNPDKPEQMAPVFTDRPFTVKIHLQHCIEILRQNIMCNADVGIIPHQWITATPDPYANFNTFHKCRDIGSVERWIKENEIPDTPDGSDLPIPLGSKIFAKPP